MNIVKVKLYNPHTGRRFFLIPSFPIGMLTFMVKIVRFFSKPSNKRKKDVEKVNNKKSQQFSISQFSNSEVKLIVNELKKVAPINIVDIKINERQVISVFIT